MRMFPALVLMFFGVTFSMSLGAAGNVDTVAKLSEALRIISSKMSGELPTLPTKTDADAPDPNKILEYAKAGNLDAIKKLVEDKKIDLKNAAADKDGMTLLHWAVYGSNPSLAIVKYLVGNGASIKAKDKENHTVLHAAVGGEKPILEIVKYLVEEGEKNGAKLLEEKDNDNWTVLHWAVTGDNSSIGIVRYLVDEKKVDVNAIDNDGATALHLAVINTHPSLDIVRYLVDEKKIDLNLKTKENKLTALDLAKGKGGKVTNPNQEIINYLETRVSDLKKLFKYAVAKNWDAVKKLVEEKKIDLNTKDENGLTVLQWAIISSNIEIIRYLLEKGADVNVQDEDGHTLLHWAVSLDLFEVSLDIIKYLVEKGANVNAIDNNSYTVLHAAVKSTNSKLEIVEYLVDEKKIDLNVKSITGRTALDLAETKTYPNQEIIDYLKSKLAMVRT